MDYEDWENEQSLKAYSPGFGILAPQPFSYVTLGYLHISEPQLSHL